MFLLSIITVLPKAKPFTSTPQNIDGFLLPVRSFNGASPFSPPTIYVAFIPPKIAYDLKSVLFLKSSV